MSYSLGLVSISFRDHSAKEILEAMKKSGLSVIEWGSDIHAPKDDINKLREIVKMQNEYDIECCSYGTYFNLGVDDVAELEDYIKAAKLLGTDILRLWCGNKGSAEYSESEAAFLFEECKKAAKIAQEHNVKLCLECHNWTYTDTKESALSLIKAVNSKHFLMYWQPNQFRTVEENINYATALSPYTEHLHVFNWKEKQKFPLCDGVDTWQKYLKCFEKDKTLLLEFMPDGEIASLEAESAALKRMAGE